MELRVGRIGRQEQPEHILLFPGAVEIGFEAFWLH
jgi:hypothetical protein